MSTGRRVEGGEERGKGALLATELAGDSDPVPDEFYNYYSVAAKLTRPLSPLMELCFHETILACLCRRQAARVSGRLSRLYIFDFVASDVISQLKSIC